MEAYKRKPFGFDNNWKADEKEGGRPQNGAFCSFIWFPSVAPYTVLIAFLAY